MEPDERRPDGNQVRSRPRQAWEEHQELTRSFELESFALAFAEGQRIRPEIAQLTIWRYPAVGEWQVQLGVAGGTGHCGMIEGPRRLS